MADEKLNKTYQEVMLKLPPKSRTQLRDVQRTWLEFMQRDCAAAGAAASTLGKKEDEIEEFKVGEFDERSYDLASFLDREPEAIYRWDDKTRQERQLSKSELEVLLHNLDTELDVVYERCLHLLPAEPAAQFRDAQHAWVAFRNATKPFGTYRVLKITGFRISQLSAFYIGQGLEPQPYQSQQADSSVPDPFERAR